MRSLFTNSALWLPISVAFGVQLYKTLANWVRTGRLDWRVLSQTGGMPRSHSGLGGSLLAALRHQYGLGPSLFHNLRRRRGD